MNDDEIAELLTAVELAWPRDRPAGWQKMWIPHLRDLPADAALPAMNRLVRSKTFPPSVAEVREATAAEMGVLPPGDGAHAGLDWARAWMESEMEHGPKPDHPSPAVLAAVRAFGGVHKVEGDPDGWGRFWRSWVISERSRVLTGDLDRLALGS